MVESFLTKNRNKVNKEMSNNQRIANLHYVLDELDRLYTAIQNGVLLDANQSRKQLIESYQSQRRYSYNMIHLFCF